MSEIVTPARYEALRLPGGLAALTRAAVDAEPRGPAVPGLDHGRS